MKANRPSSWIKMAVLVLGTFIAVRLVLPLLPRDTFKVTAQRQWQWILQAVQDLSQAAPPSLPPASGTNTSRENSWWGHPNYLIFSNGWAAYRINSIHDGPDVGDIAVLRTSEGAFYYSNQHYCAGITESMDPMPGAKEEIAAPSDLKDFLEHDARPQRWNAFAPGNGLWCILSCPRLRGSKKPISVWISTGEGTNRSTLWDRRYEVSASRVSWATHWSSNDSVAVDIYDYSDTSLGGAYALSTKSNCVMSLSFGRDNQTGQFTDKR
jgi:hypothetical protein